MRRWIPRSYQSVGCETTSASCWLSAQLSAKTGGRRKPSARSHHCGQYKVLFREKRWKELDKVASSCKNLNNILRASVFYTQMPRQSEASFNMKWMMTNQVLCTTPAMSESARRSLLWKSNKLCEPGWLGHSQLVGIVNLSLQPLSWRSCHVNHTNTSETTNTITWSQRLRVWAEDVRSELLSFWLLLLFVWGLIDIDVR